jgi:hypothetical protein
MLKKYVTRKVFWISKEFFTEFGFYFYIFLLLPGTELMCIKIKKRSKIMMEKCQFNLKRFIEIFVEMLDYIFITIHNPFFLFFVEYQILFMDFSNGLLILVI